MQFKGEEKNLEWVLRRGSPGEKYSVRQASREVAGLVAPASPSPNSPIAPASARYCHSEGPQAGGEGVLFTRENEAGSLNLDRGHELKAGGTGVVKLGNSKPWAPAAPPGLPETLHTDV